MVHMMAAAVDVASAIHFDDLGLSPVALQLGPLAIRWYSLGYIAGIVIGWWYLLKLLDRPGAPMARRHADDFVTWATIGIILGGRLGYILFYKPLYYAQNPLEMLRLWEGGMAFHGGVLGTMIAIIVFARRNGLNWLRVHDYVACCVPFGLFFVRIANFINGELWGRPTTVPWAIVFPNADALPRHPSQLYEAVLEGPVLFAILAYAFWRTDARWRPGMLVGLFILSYGLFRFVVEFYREPDNHLVEFARITGLHMGQWLCVPMILGGVFLVARAARLPAATVGRS